MTNGSGGTVRTREIPARPTELDEAQRALEDAIRRYERSGRDPELWEAVEQADSDYRHQVIDYARQMLAAMGIEVNDENIGRIIPLIVIPRLWELPPSAVRPVRPDDPRTWPHHLNHRIVPPSELTEILRRIIEGPSIGPETRRPEEVERMREDARRREEMLRELRGESDNHHHSDHTEEWIREFHEESERNIQRHELLHERDRRRWRPARPKRRKKLQK